MKGRETNTEMYSLGNSALTEVDKDFIGCEVGFRLKKIVIYCNL